MLDKDLMKPVTTQNNNSEDEGFIRLSTDEIRENLLDALIRIVTQGTRIVLQQAGEDVAAIIPAREFTRLDALIHEIKSSLYFPEDDEYYEDERGIHCIYPDEVKSDFADILAAVRVDGELFGLLPTPNLGGKDVDIFMPVAVLMPIEKFWLPEYIINEGKRRWN
jgi:hypothetical protein